MIISIESAGVEIQIEDDKDIVLPAAGMLDKHGSIFEVAELTDAWVSADYHFGKWLRKEGEEAEKLKAEEEKIIELHNARVGNDDIFLFLGDISESEFGDEFRPEAMKYVIEQVQKLNGRKILLTGNNDTCDNAFYKKCGFEEIFRRDRIVTDKHVFSHFPVNMRDSTRINIHGHLHYSGKYLECNTENHIDVYWKAYNGPIRISSITKDLVDNYVKNVAKLELINPECKNTDIVL